MKTAVLLITFNRLEYLQKTFAAVRKVKPPRLYIASDGPRPQKEGEKEQVEEVRNWMLSHIDWPCEVKTRFLKTNSGGCKYGVSGAVSWLFANEPEGIILEDDCVPDETFFSYCEELLEKYRDDKRIWHIAGDAPIEVDIPESYYFAKIMHCWGWASWADRWKHFSLDISKYGKNELKKFSDNRLVQKYWHGILKSMNRNEIDTWDYQWTFHIVAHDGLCINPAHCLVSNVGEIGVHFDGGANNALNHKLVPITKIVHPAKVELNEEFVERIYKETFGIVQPELKIKKYKLFGWLPLLTTEEL